MSTGILQSYRFCKRIARKKAGNFYYAFLLLPKNKRNAIYAVYAFMRHSDDIVDEQERCQAGRGQDKHVCDSAAVKTRLHAWRGQVETALHGGETTHPVLPALVDTVKRFAIPEKLLFELLDGVEMDLERNRYRTFDELYQYCYRVASVVGLVCVYIFGFKDSRVLAQAESAGIAFQLTNILRDIRADYQVKRVYIPLEDLEKFRYPEKNLSDGIVDDRFRRLIHYEIERAREYYHQSEGIVSLVSPESQKALSALIGIYRGLLEKISRQYDQVFEKRIHLSLLEKLSIVYRAWRNPTMDQVA